MVSLGEPQTTLRDPHTRRATVSSQPPSFSFANPFDSGSTSGSSRRYEPYQHRRQTVSSPSPKTHVQSPPLSQGTPYPFAAHSPLARGLPWNTSASPSPMLSSTLLPSGPGSSPSSNASFEYMHGAFGPSFSLPSPVIPRRAAMDGLEDSPPFAYDSPLPQHPFHPTTSVPDTPPLDDLSLEEARATVAQLRDRVRELEFVSDLARLRAAELEVSRRPNNHSHSGNDAEFPHTFTPAQSHATDPDHPFQVYTPSSQSSPPYNPHIGLPPPDWSLRTIARTRRFCALNRAGNALCAWHDSRRERRAYPPRMAPSETLNCGCSYREALFEESLARNGVGAFWPGESVRMDPVLRNNLLRLLEEKYGYKDGDFERNADGGWKDGEDARSWEQRAQRPTRRER